MAASTSFSALRPAPSGAVQPPERIRVLDVLRGFALPGMLLVHTYEHSGDARGAWERAVDVMIRTFVSERSFPTFAFLFGVGFAIQLRDPASPRRRA